MKTEATTARRGVGNTPGRNGYRYRQQFGVIVICDNEKDQARAYAKLQRAGFRKVRVVTV